MFDSRTRIVAWACCVALASARAGLADFGGRALLAWQSYDAEELKTDGLRQLYDLHFERDFTDTLRLRLSFRGEDDSSGSTFLDERRSTDFRQVEPRGRLTWQSGALQAFGDWDRLRARAGGDGDAIESERALERTRANLSYHRDNLPGLSVDGQRDRTTNPSAGVELTETRGTASLDYAWRGLTLGASQRSLELEDLGSGFDRRHRDLLGTLGFAGSWWGDRLAFQLDTLASRGRIEERSLGAAAAVPNPISVASVFQTLDATPQDDFDQPLVANSQLRDDNLTAAAGAPLGPTAPVDLNLALDIGRFAQVDEIRIVARDPAGNPLATGGAVAWDLYTSDDFILWKRVTSSVLSRFDAGRSLWSVTFPQATLRYLKVVTFFVNSVPTEVTEVQALFTTQLAPRESVTTDTTLRSGTSSVTLRPLRSVTLGWWGQLNDSTQSSLARGELTTNDRDQRVSLLWAPKSWGNLELQRQRRRAVTTSQLGESVQEYAAWNGYARWTPGRNLSSTLEVSRIEDDLEGQRVDQERDLLHFYARYWEAVDITLDGGVVRQEQVTQGWSVRSPILSGSLRANLTRALVWTTTASLQRNNFAGKVPAGTGLQDRDQRWTTELFWRPSGRFGIGARAGRASNGANSGTLQTYQLQWQPFPDGAITLSTLFDEDLDPVSDRRSRRLILTPSWRINRSLLLSLNYLDLETAQGPIRQQTRSFYAALTLTF